MYHVLIRIWMTDSIHTLGAKAHLYIHTYAGRSRFALSHLQTKLRRVFSVVVIAKKPPNLYTTVSKPLWLSTQPSLCGDGSDHNRSHPIPYAGTTDGRFIWVRRDPSSVCLENNASLTLLISSSFSMKGDMPPCAQKIFPAMIAATGMQLNASRKCRQIGKETCYENGPESHDEHSVNTHTLSPPLAFFPFDGHLVIHSSKKP